MEEDTQVYVEILDMPGLPRCSCVTEPQALEYGPTESTEKQVERLKTILEDAFPGKVKVKYVKLLEMDPEQRNPRTAAFISRYRPPWVIINGQLKFAFGVPADLIKEEVGKILEASTGFWFSCGCREF